ncbi:PTS sugar transporter subunit IIA [Rodentibacter myodis]|uniref:PTS system glucose-specific EIIA component n=1 Tax=Rodentibacter myodis TaxID=1907939 RepID=A0A1V3JNQ8_9PAST|nr:glucose PTS transporter subunit IIA [Rodentibacter myodis]OOF58029.1 NagE protein [Rodentibacter myodis]
MLNEQFIIPMTGSLLHLEQVPDKHFSDKSLGEGFAIKLSGEVVVSPISGIVIAAFPSGHAFIIRREEDGLEVLVHIGLDSVRHEGAFRPQVQKYARVKQGDVLTYVDKSKFTDNENALISPIVFSNPNIQISLHTENKEVKVGDENIIGVKL